MAIAKREPNTILLGGVEHVILVNDYVVGVVATPGMLAEMYDVAGENRWRPNASATEIPTIAVFIEQIELNHGIDYPYQINDLAKVAFLQRGCTFYALVPSGQNIQNGELLQSNGDGKLKSATATTADANLARFQSLDNIGSVTVDTRCRVQVIN